MKMNMNLKSYISFTITLITLNINAQETEFKAVVSKNKLGLNQQLRVEYTINKQGSDNFKAPNFTNFKIIRGLGKTTTSSWINGKRTDSKSFNYTIKPKQKGEFNLPSASIELKGKTLSSKPVKIIVTDPVDLFKKPNDPNNIAQQNIHLVTKISNLHPKVNEKITVEHSLYGSEILKLFNLRILGDTTDEKDFNIKVIETKINMKDTILDVSGKKYRYTIFKKYEMTPKKVGRFYINPIKVMIHTKIPNGNFDFFSNPIYYDDYEFFSTEKKEINVRK